ncbi:hypothetical protein [Solimonas soli]|uniref:hypothetical protein n=1 Tax=Solimonas soli TaxID=413479 RepID=UPI000481AD34|nr:hypothetical protein [Solimonas soli]
MNRTLLPMLLLPLALGACSYFSQTPDSALVTRVHQEIPVGVSTDDAEIKLGAMDFACSPVLKHGAYTDERGVDHENARYMQCLRKPSRIGFACENRDQVLIVPTADGKVGSIDVIRGPNCQP